MPTRVLNFSIACSINTTACVTLAIFKHLCTHCALSQALLDGFHMLMGSASTSTAQLQSTVAQPSSTLSRQAGPDSASSNEQAVGFLFAQDQVTHRLSMHSFSLLIGCIRWVTCIL
jgi:hypothetical protein